MDARRTLDRIACAGAPLPVAGNVNYNMHPNINTNGPWGSMLVLAHSLYLLIREEDTDLQLNI